MGKIDELIQQYCPDGVEYVNVGDVCDIHKGVQFNKSDMKEMGSYPVINGGINPSGYAEVFNEDGSTITISQGGASAGYVNFLDSKFWLGAHCYALKPYSVVMNRYLYHYIKQNEITLQQCQYGAGIPALAKSTISSLEIPLPPLPVQKAIVNILDRFAVYAAELQAELQARQQQYQYYRNLMLSFEDNNTQVLQLQQCVSDDCSMSYGIVQPGDDYCGGVPVVRPVDLAKHIIHIQGIKTIKPELLHSYSRTELKGGELLVCVRGTTGVVSFAGDDLRGGNVSRGIVPLRFNTLIDSHYMYHLFNSDYVRTQIEDKTRGAALQQINVGDLKKILIPVPPIIEQKRIATILDRFNTLVNDLSQGLPAEIEARRQQYEYYRDKLLTFKRKEE